MNELSKKEIERQLSKIGFTYAEFVLRRNYLRQTQNVKTDQDVIDYITRENRRSGKKRKTQSPKKSPKIYQKKKQESDFVQQKKTRLIILIIIGVITLIYLGMNG